MRATKEEKLGDKDLREIDILAHKNVAATSLLRVIPARSGRASPFENALPSIHQATLKRLHLALDCQSRAS